MCWSCSFRWCCLAITFGCSLLPLDPKQERLCLVNAKANLMPATAHLTAALASSHFAASLLVISLIEATGVLCSLLTALTALCSAPVMLLAWLRACVSLLVLLQLAWLRHACSLAGGIAAIVQLRHPADCQSA